MSVLIGLHGKFKHELYIHTLYITIVICVLYIKTSLYFYN